MQLPTLDFPFVLLTPCFSGTAEGREARISELRTPPIRGHLRVWHRAAFGNPSVNRVWGSTDGHEGSGSRVAVRILDHPGPSESPALLLPHKTKDRGPRPALPANATATFRLQRLPACTDDDWAKAGIAAQLWLVGGALGCRSNRAAGSVWPTADGTPRTPEELTRVLAPILAAPRSPWGAALIGENAGNPWQVLRETASDTPKGPAHLFGNAKPREPSHVRFKVVRLDSGLCLLALAPSRNLIADAEAALLAKPDPHRWEALGSWRRL